MTERHHPDDCPSMWLDENGVSHCPHWSADNLVWIGGGPSLAHIHWSRETVTLETRDPGKEPTTTTRVKTSQRATILDSPVMDDPRTWITTATATKPWVADQLAVVDEQKPHDPQPRRRVAIFGYHLNKNGSRSRMRQGKEWSAYENPAARGSLATMPEWVRVLVDELEPADDGVLT